MGYFALHNLCTTPNYVTLGMGGSAEAKTKTIQINTKNTKKVTKIGGRESKIRLFYVT